MGWALGGCWWWGDRAGGGCRCGVSLSVVVGVVWGGRGWLVGGVEGLRDGGGRGSILAKRPDSRRRTYLEVSYA